MTEIQKGLEQFEGGAVVHGVPKVSYFGNPPELTPFPACLKTALLDDGAADIPYAHYLCMSGAAFRLMWNRMFWDGGNVDILGMCEDPVEPLVRAFAAAGRDCTIYLKPKIKQILFRGGDNPHVRWADREQMLDAIRARIGGGALAIAFGVVGPPEACVITGYQKGGDELIGWSFFQDMPEMTGPVEQTSDGYFIKGGWFEQEDFFGVAVPGECIAQKPMNEQLAETLAYAAGILAPRSVGDRAGGLDAFDAWEKSLLDDTQFPENAPVPLLFERLMCQSDAHTEVAEGRSYAAGWLEYWAERFPQAAEPMKKAAALFHRSHETVWEMWSLIGGLGMSEVQAGKMGEKDVRVKLAEHIRRLKQYDAQAIPLVKEAAALLK